jgi:hypothetical protein
MPGGDHCRSRLFRLGFALPGDAIVSEITDRCAALCRGWAGRRLARRVGHEGEGGTRWLFTVAVPPVPAGITGWRTGSRRSPKGEGGWPFPLESG